MQTREQPNQVFTKVRNHYPAYGHGIKVQVKYSDLFNTTTRVGKRRDNPEIEGNPKRR